MRRHGRPAQPQHHALRAVSRPAARVARPPPPARPCAPSWSTPRRPLEERLGRDRAPRWPRASRRLRRADRPPAARLARPPMPSPSARRREIPVEAVVERLIQMTPERLVDRMGPAFVTTPPTVIIRLLDLPVIRRLPGIRNLVVYREKSPAEAVALAANYFGHLIQRGLDVAYFLADLHGTLSPPVFLDRLGATIVNATRTPAKRLLFLGSAFLVLFLIVQVVARSRAAPGRRRQDLQPAGLAGDHPGRDLPGLLVAGCLVPQDRQPVGRLLRAGGRGPVRRPHQEPQVPPPRAGRAVPRRAGDRPRAAPARLRRSGADTRRRRARTSRPERPAGRFLFENRELAFLRNVRLLYQDYLDGSPLHRSDTKASIQLLGNLALANLRRSHLRHLLRESRLLDRLDLSRAGGLFGGPYLWFNYITRLTRAGDGAPDPRLQPARDPARPAGVLARVDPRGLPRLAGAAAQGRARGDLAARSAVREQSGRCTHRPNSGPGESQTRPPDPSRRFAPRLRAVVRPKPSWRRSSSPRSTSWPTIPSATPRSTRGSGPRSPSWCAATASRTSAGRSGASRSTSCRPRPARSTRSPSTRRTSPGAGSSCCRST